MAGEGAEGLLLIDLHWQPGRVFRVAVRSTRPLGLPAIFLGKKPAEVTATLPLIYRICGAAQGCAAAEALEQALAVPVAPAGRMKRRLLVAFETLREHLWRIELDWPRFIRRPVDSAGIARASALLREFRTLLFREGDPFTPGGKDTKIEKERLTACLEQLERLLQERVFTLPSRKWLEIRDRQTLSDWSRRRATIAQEMLFQVEAMGEAGLGRSGVKPLQGIGGDTLERRLAGPGADGFIAQPDWRGAPAETTPYSRRRGHPLLIDLAGRHGNGLLPRLTARLVELAALVGELRGGREEARVGVAREAAAGAGPGIGLAQVEAARGRLIHRVELEAGRVSNYQILAPTEWNFHPAGVLAAGLIGVAADSETDLKRKADLLIQAIDPCVGYRLRIDRPARNPD